MDLFNKEHLKDTEFNLKPPLAYRMRPQNFSEFVGQEHIIGEDSLLRKSIEQDELTSLIFWGPPGSGKTTLAMIIANLTQYSFEQFSAVTSGIAEIKEVMKRAKMRSKRGEKTILFVDEIHRFNKAQQDAFLPYVEQGTIVLIGATTQNPYFEINSALLSRSKIYKLEPLSENQIINIIKRAIKDKERGLGKYNLEIDELALHHIVNIANGDARIALNALELAALNTPVQEEKRKITLKIAEESTQQRSLTYDKDGDSHYDTISAFIKSIRGSDPDAALYWLARMIHCGENPRFIARRLIICAAEDVGNADPLALLLATAAAQAVEYVGMPEAQIPLAQAVTYIACAPKSNSAYLGINKALKDVENLPNLPIPLHLRDANYQGAKILGHQKDYKYPHNSPSGYIPQEYVPENIKGRRYYQPTNHGYEAKLKMRLDKWRKQKREKIDG